MKECTMFGSPVFGFDTSAWLAEHRRTTAALVERAMRPSATTEVRNERQQAAAAGCGELACC